MDNDTPIKSAQAAEGVAIESSIDMLGASVRYPQEGEELGSIRFGLEFSKEDYAAVTASADVKIGILLIPQSKLNCDLTFDVQGVGSATLYGDGENGRVNAFHAQEDGAYRAYAYLWDIPITAYNQNIVARGYVQDGAGIRYSSETIVRCLNEVALCAYNDTTTNESNKEKLLDYLRANEYAVSFGEETRTYYYGDTFSVPTAVNAGKNKTFVGWREADSPSIVDFSSENADKVTGDVTYTPKFADGSVLAVETFTDGRLMDQNGVSYYQGEALNAGAQLDKYTMSSMNLDGDRGLIWSVASTLGQERISFRYNGYAQLDFTGGKQYAARVGLTTPENFSETGYITVYGYKSQATDSYKVAGTSNDVFVTGEKGSTGRKMLGGQNQTTYYDFILNGAYSSEFFIMFHADSNVGKAEISAEIAVSSVEIIDLSTHQPPTATETFEDGGSLNTDNWIYTGTHFNVAAAAADTMSVTALPAPQFSIYTENNGLYWVSKRVWKKGLTVNDEGDQVTHNAKLVITYKDAFDRNGAYSVRIPLYMQANDLEQVKTTSVELSYSTGSIDEDTYKENWIQTKFMGWGQSLAVFEVTIPADSDWNGGLILRLYNEAITANSASSKMLCYLDGVSVWPAQEDYAIIRENEDPTALGYQIDKTNMFGICAVASQSELYTSSADAGVTTDLIADVVDVMNVKSVRVWMHLNYVIERSAYGNTLTFKQEAIQKYHAYFAKLKAAGVENIVVMNHHYVYPYGYDYTYMGVVPDPKTEMNTYMTFLNMFEECYRILSKEFPEITLWEPNNEMDHPKGTTIVKNGYKSGADNSAYLYTVEETARITVDLCYYANRGIKANNPFNELVMPALCFFWLEDNPTEFLEAMYRQIYFGSLPTSYDVNGNRILPVDRDTDNYFNVLNWHPYVNTDPTREPWLQVNKDMYEVAVKYGDGGKKLFLTEFGWSEYDGNSEADIGEWYPEALNMLQEVLPTLEAVFAFRMFDYTATTGREATFGIFNSPDEATGATPKAAAISLFTYFNGEDVDVSVLERWKKQ
ncbi:MAG: hypothetical protein IJX49_02240 [Clostridia bacterium]|nr:hypothetical protein [Clostridia bacterium]